MRTRTAIGMVALMSSGMAGIVVGAQDDPVPRTAACPWVDHALRVRAEPWPEGRGAIDVPAGLTAPIRVSSDGGAIEARVRLEEPGLGHPAEWAAAHRIADTGDFDGVRLEAPVLIGIPGGYVALAGDATRRDRTFATHTLDGGATWSPLRVLPASLSGRGHRGAIAPDGRILIALRDETPWSPTEMDLVLWVGDRDDLLEGRAGAYTARLLEHDAKRRIEVAHLTCSFDGAIGVIANLDGSTVVLQTTLDELDALVPTPGTSVPLIDLDADTERQVIVDREPGQYLGHPTTCLLEDGRTILCVYPKGHGKGGIVFKRSEDGGRTWSERLPTPESWGTSREVPTLHRTIDPATGARRLIMWSGLYPARLASSDDDGRTWTELAPAGDWGGIVVMGFVEQLADGSYLAMFHDDGRFFRADGTREDPVVFTLYQTRSRDAGRTWSAPTKIWSGSDVHLCEPGCVRSPDGRTLAVLLRENSRTRNSFVIFSNDEGATWSPPRELPGSLTGDRHTARYAPDGRLFISFRDTARSSATQGDWVGWVGTWEDIRLGRPGQYRVRLKDNHHRWDCAYPGVEVLPDGTFVTTTYGHWTPGESPFILSVRFRLDELDARLRGR